MSGYELPHKKVEANVGALKRHAFAFDNMFSSITGRSASFNAITNTTATNFSELIDDDIRAAADENQEAWEDAILATIHAQGVITLYVTAVETYEEGIESLKEELARAVASSDDHAEKQEWVEYYKGKADEKWATLETSATEASESLATGPTPEGIRELVEGGHLGDVPGGLGWIVTGDDRYFSFPPGIDGNDLARTFDRAADGDENALRDLDENLALMNAFLTSVANRQEKGDPLTERELEILGDLIETMDLEEPGSSGDGYFFTNMNGFQESEHLTQEQKDQLLSTMGGSVLALSDESIGGGYDQLPQSIHEVVEGPLGYLPYSSKGGAYSPGWASDFEILTEMFDDANDMFNEYPGGPLIGGAELSANLTGTIAGVVVDPLTGGTDDETLQTMLDISTQNKDANYAILTGEYPDGESYKHPTYFSVGGGMRGTEFGELVTSLFSHEWEDDGAAARGLIDWLAEDSLSDDKELRERAGIAAAGFVDLVTTSDAQDALTDTGVKVGDSKDASFTEFNPELADAFAGVFETYIVSFAESDIKDGGETIIGAGNYDSSTERFDIGIQERAAYMQYLMGDEDSAMRTIGLASAYEHAAIELYIGHGLPESTAVGPATLHSLIELGISMELEDRVGDDKNAEERREELYGFALDEVGSLAEKIPVLGNAISTGLGLGSGHIAEGLAGSNVDFAPKVPHIDDAESRRIDQKLQFLSHVLDSKNDAIIGGPDEGQIDLLEKCGVIHYGEDGSIGIEVDQSEWNDIEDSDGVSISGADAVFAALDGTTIDPSKVDPTNGNGLYDQFATPYNDRYELVQELGRRDSGEDE
ncbi:hypothetical protein [Nocardiopsis sp. CC223A]|uniref:TPR repeat region-containing protein n=1 Tax=Nocardiopsis sp. CC223A TaxID=3044051 RepID=UPI00278C2BF1|nr:hypothetical protein [Nocardiopsis sp. CC223A]